MIWFRDEGELLRQGFNVYPPNSKSSRGFILRIWNYVFRCRYSLKLKHWVFSWDKINVD